jgi:hypothetical protein
MTKEELLDFYDHNWNDHNIVFNMLNEVFDDYEREINTLKQQLKNKASTSDNTKEIQELKAMLLECQDKLDEETHSIKSV